MRLLALRRFLKLKITLPAVNKKWIKSDEIRHRWKTGSGDDVDAAHGFKYKRYNSRYNAMDEAGFRVSSG